MPPRRTLPESRASAGGFRIPARPTPRREDAAPDTEIDRAHVRPLFDALEAQGQSPELRCGHLASGVAFRSAAMLGSSRGVEDISAEKALLKSLSQRDLDEVRHHRHEERNDDEPEEGQKSVVEGPLSDEYR